MTPDIEALLLDRMKEQIPELADDDIVDEHVGTEEPDNLNSHLPFVRVLRTGGPGTVLDDYPVVDLDFFGPDRPSAYDLAQSVHAMLMAPPGVPIDYIAVRTAPRRLPWEDRTVVRFGATYEFGVRRR